MERGQGIEGGEWEGRREGKEREERGKEEKEERGRRMMEGEERVEGRKEGGMERGKGWRIERKRVCRGTRSVMGRRDEVQQR